MPGKQGTAVSQFMAGAPSPVGKESGKVPQISSDLTSSDPFLTWRDSAAASRLSQVFAQLQQCWLWGRSFCSLILGWANLCHQAAFAGEGWRQFLQL